MKTMYLYLNNATITFTQKGKGESVIVDGDGLHNVRLSIGEANALWNGKRSLGWTSDKIANAPKEPKVWKDRGLYEECAEALGLLWRRGDGKTYVSSGNRQKVYDEMKRRGWEG